MERFTTLLLLFFSVTAYATVFRGAFCDMRVGMADSYVLALSSQPGFCQTYGYEAGKPECTQLPKNSYQAKHLTLHGLWPTQAACGQRYGYCDVPPKVNYCAYPLVQLSPFVSEHLKKLMPSYYYGSCLERHEWNKHGSCQILSADGYFSLAMRLTEAVNRSLFGIYLTKHQGRKIPLIFLKKQITQAFGKKNLNKIFLGCKNGILVDVYIHLPALIPLEESLESLIDKASDSSTHDTCPREVTLSNFNKESWF